ncbi:hypothetical protein DQ04_00881120 [Trypanosoma grayi]|uniref:hypothetical protein n=1 Tax=Trypanosoma grayi TaxID=71804 RepID=UPI0004F4ADA5|nr:hypothetical protein DQ04_00881120 [Trypanosoma grayi]KEG13644.1 hypothetical protein DQ04_00881120 [Trypanosoma grayi]
MSGKSVGSGAVLLNSTHGLPGLDGEANASPLGGYNLPLLSSRWLSSYSSGFLLGPCDSSIGVKDEWPKLVPSVSVSNNAGKSHKSSFARSCGWGSCIFERISLKESAPLSLSLSEDQWGIPASYAFNDGTETKREYNDELQEHTGNIKTTTPTTEDDVPTCDAHRVRTLLVFALAGGGIKGLDGTADDVLMWDKNKSSIKNGSLNDLCTRYASGFNATLLIAYSQRSIAVAEDLFVAFTRQTAAVSTKGNTPCVTVITAAAMPPDGTVADLMWPSARDVREKLEIGVNPVFGSCIANLNSVELKDEYHGMEIAKDILQNAKLLGVDASRYTGGIVWVMVLLKQVRDEGKDVFLSAMHIVLIGGHLKRFDDIAMKKRERDLGFLLTNVLATSAKAVFASVVDFSVENRAALNIGLRLQEMKMDLPCDGSVRKFIDNADAELNDGTRGKCKREALLIKGTGGIEKVVQDAQLFLTDTLCRPVKVYLTSSKSWDSSEAMQSHPRGLKTPSSENHSNIYQNSAQQDGLIFPPPILVQRKGNNARSSRLAGRGSSFGTVRDGLSLPIMRRGILKGEMCRQQTKGGSSRLKQIFSATEVCQGALTEQHLDGRGKTSPSRQLRFSEGTLRGQVQQVAPPVKRVAKDRTLPKRQIAYTAPPMKVYSESEHSVIWS